MTSARRIDRYCGVLQRALLSFGHVYLCDGHVRIDIVRHLLSRRRQAGIELAGGVAIVLPVCAYLVQYGADSAWLASSSPSNRRTIYNVGVPFLRARLGRTDGSAHPRLQKQPQPLNRK